MIAGSIFYILSLCVGIVELVIISKKSGDDKPINKNKKSLLSKLARIIEGVVLLTGLTMMMFRENSKGLAIAGTVIWVGSILIYFLSGILIEAIAKIPLEFGYGGWTTKKRRTRR